MLHSRSQELTPRCQEAFFSIVEVSDYFLVPIVNSLLASTSHSPFALFSPTKKMKVYATEFLLALLWDVVTYHTKAVIVMVYRKSFLC